MTYPLYDTNSGRCKVCGADTLWGHAPHAEEGCELAKALNQLNSIVKWLDQCAEAIADFGFMRRMLKQDLLEQKRERRGV